MRAKIRNLTLQSRRGVMALAIPITLSIPAVALAAVPASASPYTQAPTYTNSAKAASARNWRTNWSVKFQMRQSYASTVTADNEAVATTSNCHDCGAIAIGFQILLVTSQNLASVTADNDADATSTVCIRCSTLAAAYQIIYASGPQQRLTGQQEIGLAMIGGELETLRYSGLNTDQIQSRADDLANQAVSILENGTGLGQPATVPAFSPAPTGSVSPAALAENSRPVVDLFRKVQHPNG